MAITRLHSENQHVALRAQRSPLAARSVPQRSGLAGTLLAMQRTHGNRFVQRFLAAATQGGEGAPPEVEEGIQQTRGGGHALQTGVHRMTGVRRRLQQRMASHRRHRRCAELLAGRLPRENASSG